ncbi:hypothetical protein J6W34_03305 [bacterium]|nr:hypothetical protein [bacterium]
MKKINTEELLNKVQKKCSTRTITLEEISKTLNDYTESLSISKKSLIGTEIVDCDLNAQNFPNAYRFTPESTHFSAIYKSTGWVITDIWRSRTNAPTKKLIAKLSETAKESLIARFECNR